MPLNNRIIVRGNNSSLRAQEDINVKTIRVTDSIDLKKIQIEGHPEINQILVNPDDSMWAHYYTKKQTDELLKTKQDVIRFIQATDLSGQFTAEKLALLQTNKVNRIVFNNIIYYLSIVNENEKKYFSRIESSEYNEVDVNMETGQYVFISKMNPIIEDHINNTTIHITENERLY